MGKDEFGRNRKFTQRGKEKQFSEIQEKDIIQATKRLNIHESEDSDEEEPKKETIVKEEEEKIDSFFNRK